MGLLSESLIAYVNLDHRKDRRDQMEANLHLHGINAIRKRGILPEERTEDKSVMTKMLSRPHKGALGCFLAQMDIMRDALYLDKHAWIMEDDLVFCSDFNKRIEYWDNWINNVNWGMSQINELGESRFIRGKRDFDVLWLGSTFHVNPPWHHVNDLGCDAERTDDDRILRTYGSFSTYGYIVNKNSLERVIAMLESTLPTSIGIDASFITLSPQLNTYAMVPGALKQYDSLSDQIPGKQIVTEFSRFGKLNGTEANSAYWWQDKMEDFDPNAFNWAEAERK